MKVQIDPSAKERKKKRREDIEQGLAEVKALRLDEISKLKNENEILREKLEKYKSGEAIMKASPEHKKLSPTEKLLLSSGNKKFLEDSLGKKEQKKEISNFNEVLKQPEIINLIVPTIEKPKNTLKDRLVDIYSSDYYTSMSDLEVDKTEIEFLNNLIKDPRVFERLDYLANVEYINKIAFLKPEIKTNVLTSNLGIPTAPKLNIPNVPNLSGIPIAPKLNLTMPNKGNIPNVPNLLSLLNQPKLVELDNTLEDVTYIALTKDDICVGEDTLYLGKFVFAKLFQNYLVDIGVKKIPASVKTSLTLDSKPLLKLRESYFIDNSFSFKDLEKYLLIGYNAKDFEFTVALDGKINIPPFSENLLSFTTDNDTNLKDYYNFFSIKFNYKQYLEYAVTSIVSEIKLRLGKYHSLDELTIRLQYKHSNIYDEQMPIITAQFNTFAKGIAPRVSKNRIEKILKQKSKVKDLELAILEYKEPEQKKIEPKKLEEQIKKKERIMLLQALGIDVKSKSSDSTFSMKYEMQIKNLKKQGKVDEIVDCLIEMTKSGLRKDKDDKLNGAKDQDIARILLDNLTKYSQMK